MVIRLVVDRFKKKVEYGRECLILMPFLQLASISVNGTDYWPSGSYWQYGLLSHVFSCHL